MEKANCFYTDLKTLMEIHNIKKLDVTANIVRGKLFVDKITVVDADNNVVITTEKEY